MGLVLATKKPRFWISFILVFIVFGTLLSLLSGGLNAINLFFATDFVTKLTILRDGFFALFGMGKTFSDWTLLFSTTFLQAILISLIAFVWKRRVSERTKNKHSKDSQTSSVQGASIAALLALLGSGCPTCGTALITPIISSIFSSGSLAISGAISSILTIIAIIILLLSIKKVGVEVYVIIKDEEWCQKHAPKNN